MPEIKTTTSVTKTAEFKEGDVIYIVNDHTAKLHEVKLMEKHFETTTYTSRGYSVIDDYELPGKKVYLNSLSVGDLFVDTFKLNGVCYHESGVGMGQSYWYETYTVDHLKAFIDEKAADDYVDGIILNKIKKQVREQKEQEAYAKLRPEFDQKVKDETNRLILEWFEQNKHLTTAEKLRLLAK